MTYGTIKVDTVTFTDTGVDKSVTLSGLVQNPTFSGNVTVTGTLSGVTVTGTTANFTSGNFTNISGGTHTITSGVFAAGSAASPSITFTGDLNTGIYSPGADQVAISTNGTGRLFVDASGRVGVGTSPSYALHVSGTGAVSSRTFATDATGDASFFVQNDGNGICGPLVYGSTKTAYGALASNETAFYSNRSTTIMADGASAVIKFATGGNTERLRITSAGLVGVGVSSPQATLDIFTSSVGSYFLGGGGDNKARQLAIKSSTTTNSGDTHTIDAQSGTGVLAFAITGSEAMRIDSSGRVGIGTTSPSGQLSVTFNGNAVQGITATDTGTPGAGNYYLLCGTSGGIQNVASNEIHHSAISALAFRTGSGNGTERFRCDSSGRLLVGTSSARGNFFNTTGLTPGIQLEGSSFQNRFLGLISSDNGGPGSCAGIIMARQKSGSVGGNTIVANNDSLGLLTFQGSDGTEFVDGARIEAFVDGTPGNNNMPGRLVFSTTADGASSPTERMRISQNGGTLWRSDGATSTHDLGNSNTSITGEVITVSAYRNTVNDTFKFLTCVRQGFAVALEIRDDGDVYNVNGTYGSLSDAKLKENIVDANSQWDDIKQLRVRNYNFKPETNNSTHKQIGVIAQEIENVSPGLVNTVADRDAKGNDLGTVTKSVNYSVLYMKAVKALQEAMERIETLEAKVAALESA